MSSQFHSMRHLVLLLLVSLPFASCQFFNPPEKRQAVWRVGEVQKIQYRTAFEEYTIALWQEIGGGANPGPILFQTRFGNVREFDFVVQAFDLVLSNSDKFFLWMFEGGASQQNNLSAHHMSSSYFRITDEPEPESSSSSSAAPTSTSTTSSVTVPASLSTSTSASISTETPDESANASTAPADPQAGVISTGVAVGIGVAVGAVGLAALAGIVYWLRRRRRQDRLPPNYGKAMSEFAVVQSNAMQRESKPSYNELPSHHLAPYYGEPREMPRDQQRSPVEIG
ncbi:hypothetical protein DL764_003673 [Monosporascus ibericus]|uniref:Mid2 domain-containing protein n=1 Tax=Monosporascus ibericus TaxID=155417 RepID=A0A4Q4TIA0_9PEZI|nr:hypothetical protein DL764_003673 [Monosporascus ibericus]